MSTRRLVKSTSFVISAVLCLIFTATIFGADQFDILDDIYIEEINMIKGELVDVDVHDMTRVSVTDPIIADIVDAAADELVIVAREVGRTVLFVWDEGGKRTIMIYVLNQNLDIVKSRIQKLLDAAGIHELKLRANGQEGKIVISGEVPDYKRELYDQIVERFIGDTIDLAADEEVDDLIQIDMQITELNTTLSKSLGIDWTTGSTATSTAVVTTAGTRGSGPRAGISPRYEEAVPASDGHIRDFFKIGELRRTGQLIAAVNALITEGKARILSKPKLVVKSGEEASFLVGGEVPIRTTTFSQSGSSQENIEFKEFGISMTMTPTIMRGKIDIVMNLEVSSLDASTASSVSDTVAFSTQSASTHLYLDDGQTIVLAGLIKHSESETVNRIPFVSDIPILGLLFRSRSNPVPNTDQELVIALTPHILGQDDSDDRKGASDGDGQMPMQQALRSRKFSYQRPVPYYMGVPKEMTGYIHDVQQKISQAIVYPSEAQRRGWEGTVKVGLLILNDGTLAFALVKESSGRDVFDEMAVNTTKRLAPFMAFPSDADLQELSITIPIVYSLDNY